MLGTSNLEEHLMKRRFVALSTALLVAFLLLTPHRLPAADKTAGEKPIVVTGSASPGTAALDDTITTLMRKWKIPGGAMAVVKDGKLVFAHGYGQADRDAGTPVQPDSLFRIASISKPVTAAVILLLVEQGRLNLDAKVLDVLKPPVVAGKVQDERWRQITIRQLLAHTAGFDREKSFDPMFRSNEIAEAMHARPPADTTAIIHYMLGRPLDFAPDTRWAYSNFGYCLLGRVIEQVTRQDYADAAQNLILRPAGIKRMQIGHTRLSRRLPGEVRYYTPGDPECRSVFPDEKKQVPCPYGEFYLEALDSHGGWIASTIDLLRFTTALDGSRQPCLLKPETRRLIESRPPPLAKTPAYYGLGWNVRPVGKGANWWHNGSLPGTMTLLVRTHNGLCWAALFNLRPQDQRAFLGELDRVIWEGVGRVAKWPQRDLFSQY
jgi:CubicO group peptidase (beta-lactamase class C family)